MYRITVEGKTTEELKNNLSNIYDLMQHGRVVVQEEENEEFDLGEPDTLVETKKSKPKYVAPIEEEEEEETEEVVEDEDDVIEDVEYDSENLPWDSRIHASTKTQTKTGTWKQKKGVDEATIKKVKKELYKAQAQQPEVAPVTSVKSPSAPQMIPQPNYKQSGHTIETFKINFPVILGNLISEGKVTQEYVNQLKGYFGVNEIWNINDAQKLEMFNSFVNYGFIQKVG